MGIDISGGLFVGCAVEDIYYDEDNYECIHDFAVENNMSLYSPWFDADSNDCYIGYTISNKIEIFSDDFNKLILDVKSKAEDFENLTGAKARLIGMQDVY